MLSRVARHGWRPSSKMVSQLFVSRGTHEPRRYGLTLSCARAVAAKLNKMAIDAIVFISPSPRLRAKVSLQPSYGWGTGMGEPLRRVAQSLQVSASRDLGTWGKHPKDTRFRIRQRRGAE